MPFLEPEELKTNIYAYQLDQITEGDDTIVLYAIDTAIEECSSYLTANSKTEYRDGRWIYDTEPIFSAEGNERSTLILAYTKDIAMYHIAKLCNVDFISKRIQDGYDRATDYLQKVAKGEVTPKLPRVVLDKEEEQPFRGGSRIKFNHEA
jgi:hypothetical protein